MCGRFVLREEPEFYGRLFEAGLGELKDATPSWNIGPTATILGVRATDQGRLLDAYRWGLVPSWATHPSAVTSTFNARAETVATKPMFRKAFERRRILIPADAFYEWQKLGPKEKQPYAFRRADGTPMVFAGIRDGWKLPDGTWLDSASILTTEAGPDMAAIHTRQPVLLERDTWDLWLDPHADLDELHGLLRAAGGVLDHHPVSRDVGNVKNDRPDLLEAINSL